MRKTLAAYWRLMRFDRPIGTLLVLWPTLWALWLAAGGPPEPRLVLIFVAGVVVMRAAGCVINDLADRNIDGHVKRTKGRPLVVGEISARAALILFLCLCFLAFCLVLLTNRLTLILSLGGLALTAIYPFMKRHTFLPQVVLGAAFAWAIPMAFAAVTGTVELKVWLVYITVLVWTVAYDTFYAMVDRDDDVKLGVKSTAILFGEQDRLITGLMQLIVLWGLLLMGQNFELGETYYTGLAFAAILFIYQQVLIRHRRRERCFAAFLNNNWVGLAIFLGILLDLQ